MAVIPGGQYPLAVNYRKGSEPFKRKPLTALWKETANLPTPPPCPESLTSRNSSSSLFYLILRCIMCDYVSYSTSWGLSYPLAKELVIHPFIKAFFLTCYRSGLTSRAPCLVPMEAWLLMLLIFQSISVQCKKLCNIRFGQLFFFRSRVIGNHAKTCFHQQLAIQ